MHSMAVDLPTPRHYPLAAHQPLFLCGRHAIGAALARPFVTTTRLRIPANCREWWGGLGTFPQVEAWIAKRAANRGRLRLVLLIRRFRVQGPEGAPTVMPVCPTLSILWSRRIDERRAGPGTARG